MDPNQESEKPADIDIQNIIKLLVECKCLKFGKFTLKCGDISEYYVDLRLSSEDPTLFYELKQAIKTLILTDKQFGDKHWLKAAKSDKKVAIVGVPYGVVPLAGAVASDLGFPYSPVRKENKGYGASHESNLPSDCEYILIEDVMNTGSSIIDTIKKLQGKTVRAVITVVDREAGGAENIKAQYPSVDVKSVMKVGQILASQMKN